MRLEAESELAKAEPALKEADEAVKSLDKKHIDEIRDYKQIPEASKNVVKCCMAFLGYQLSIDWD